MPVAKLPFGEWVPDKGQIENPGLAQASGGIYYTGKWFASPYVFPGTDVALGVTLSLSNAFGFHIHSKEDSNLNTQSLYFYVADSDDIYRSSAANSRALVSATSALAGLTPTNASGAQFVSYGDKIIHTNYNDHIVIATSPTTDFGSGAGSVIEYASPLTSYRPKARYITVIKNQILIGHVQFDSTAMPTNSALVASTAYPSLVMWSAVDDITRFGDPATTQDPAYDGSDYQLLADEYGAITGLVGGDYAYIFKERAIYRMDGPPYTFRPVVTGTGTMYPNSIIKYYDDIYFWGPAGPTVLRAGSSTPEILGLGKVSRTITDFTASGVVDRHLLDIALEDPAVSLGASTQYAKNISGAADYKTGLIAWMCTSEEQLSQQWTCPGKVIVYSTIDDAFSYFYIGAPSFFLKTVPQYHYPELFSTATNAGYFFNDSFFIGGKSRDINTPGNLYLRGFGFSDDLNTEPTNTATTYTYNDLNLSFSYLPLPVSQVNSEEVVASRITKIRPIYESQITDIGDAAYPPNNSFIPRPLKYTVTIYSKSRFPGEAHKTTATYSPQTDTWQDSNGWLDVETPLATHHKICIRFQDPGTTPSGQSLRDLGLLKDLGRIEVEYALGSNRGSDYIAS